MTFVTVMLIFIMFTIIQFTKTNMEQDSIQMMHNLSTKPLNLIRPNENIEVNLPFFSLKINDNMEIEESISSYYNLSDKEYLKQLIAASAKIPDKTGILSDENFKTKRPAFGICRYFTRNCNNRHTYPKLFSYRLFQFFCFSYYQYLFCKLGSKTSGTGMGTTKAIYCRCFPRT